MATTAILSEIITELDTIFNTITIANGFSVDVSVVAHDAIKILPKTAQDPTINFPRVEILLVSLTTNDISNERQEVTVNFQINSYIHFSSGISDDLASRTKAVEFAADIRTIILTVYARQQAGTFTTNQFRVVPEIRQEFFTPDFPKDLSGVKTEFNILFDLNFTER